MKMFCSPLISCKEVRSRGIDMVWKLIRLNVGGTIFSTTFETLNTQPPNMLTSLISTELPTPERDPMGRHFIDRDPRLFRHLLNFLRSGHLPNLNRDETEALLLEADYFCISPLSEILSGRISKMEWELNKDSIIDDLHKHHKFLIFVTLNLTDVSPIPHIVGIRVDTQSDGELVLKGDDGWRPKYVINSCGVELPGIRCCATSRGQYTTTPYFISKIPKRNSVWFLLLKPSTLDIEQMMTLEERILANWDHVWTNCLKKGGHVYYKQFL